MMMETQSKYRTAGVLDYAILRQVLLWRVGAQIFFAVRCGKDHTPISNNKQPTTEENENTAIRFYLTHHYVRIVHTVRKEKIAWWPPPQYSYVCAYCTTKLTVALLLRTSLVLLYAQDLDLRTFCIFVISEGTESHVLRTYVPLRWTVLQDTYYSELCTALYV